MSEMLIQRENLVAIADEIRELSGTTASMGLDAMKTNLGEANDEVGSQADLIAQIVSALDGKASDGGGSGDDYVPTLQDKTVMPDINEQKITADSGYDGLGVITVTAVPTQSKSVTPKATSQDVTPDGGMFLSKVTVAGDTNLVASNIVSGVNIFGVTGNYVGTTSTDNYEDEMINGSLTSYTNTTVSKIRDYAFCRAQSLRTVNFTACEHIGQEAFASCTSLTTVNFENCISMASSAFQGCTKLTTISFPACKSIYWAGFSSCYSLATVNLPACTYIGGRAFQKCSKLANLSLPLCRQIYSSAFQSCSALTTVSLPSATLIGSTAFGSCTKLSTFYLAGSTLCGLSGSNAFTGTGITSTTGSIYVNASLVDSYKAATNWAYFSNVIYAIE